MVQLTVTANIRQKLSLYNVLPTANPVADPSDINSIEHRTLFDISRILLRYHPSPDHDFAALLRGSSVYIPPKPPRPEPTPEYKALMARLCAEQEAQEYSKLTSDAHEDTKDDEYTFQELRSQLTIIFNVLLSTIATAVAVWMAASRWDVPERMAMAFATAIIVCVAEVVIFGSYMRRIEEAKQQEKRKATEKEVVRAWELGGKGIQEIKKFVS